MPGLRVRHRFRLATAIYLSLSLALVCIVNDLRDSGIVARVLHASFIKPAPPPRTLALKWFDRVARTRIVSLLPSVGEVRDVKKRVYTLVRCLRSFNELGVRPSRA